MYNPVSPVLLYKSLRGSKLYRCFRDDFNRKHKDQSHLLCISHAYVDKKRVKEYILDIYPKKTVPRDLLGRFIPV